MTELDQLISVAFASEGKQDDVNKVYLALLRTPLLVPIKKEVSPSSDEPFTPLFTQVDAHYFMLAFDTIERLQAWAGDYQDQIHFVEISGRDVIAGVNENVFLGLNMGTEFYKEFSPDEIKRLKMIVSRIDQMK